MINSICTNAWDITVGIFSIVGVVLSIFLSIILPLCKYIKNRVTTKTFNATFNAILLPKPPSLQETDAMMYSCNITCLNKTNKDVSIIKAEIVSNDKVVDLFSVSPNSKFTVKAQSAYSYPFRIALLPDKFQMSSETKLQLYTSNKMFAYEIIFPHEEKIC